ncbi:TPA: DNA topoisomerase (ATP-hydrolyzing) subunit B [Candidatus Dependentiae bacterium]|nr:MAG: gyrase subunit B protein [candidate division TM6 bacterium GW2011_GWE2_31_21]KKP54113.1 MAG: gyrase subunit B protein [candidate division TM6 bacterium GW2011_GWF2_33_332]HBS48305.1 DNA topoisomerase (ATP-hydrolyzing) subunit B [Candidatus Dependentiae bacterium]HBZ73021.1 DNA topoisomerase (ATP-hydrolyzing) subunit B [Candidatus Dependentiae bacterium]
MKENKNLANQKSTTSAEYGAKSIKVLEGLEAVRKRPAMYIGSTGIDGLHHLIYEVVDNSVDEALAGYCNHIVVRFETDGSCSVEDNGRGIPTEIYPTENVSTAQVVLTKLHAGGKFDKDTYKYSGGLHGVGVSVVNALSEWFEIKIFRDGKIYQQFYKKGDPQEPLKVVGETDKRGTYIRFMPDSTIFENTEFNFETISTRMRELAFLNKGLNIEVKDEKNNQEHDFFFENGIVSFIEHINSKKVPIFSEIIQFHKEDEIYMLDFACQYNDGYAEQTFSFVNNIRTMDGGTHEAGFKSALTKACNRYAQSLNLLKDGSFSSEDVREGLVCVLSIKVPEPQFEGQTKGKLGNSEVKGVVDSWMYALLETYFEENPNIAKKIIQKSILAQQARNAAKKARELTRRKSVLEFSVLPGKLADCSDDNPENTEIYIVEGDSAGGSAKQGRDRFTQAILPLKGKIINVEKARLDKMLNNNEIKDLITAIGAGVGNEEFDSSKVRYHKIIIMTDADVDGAHIRILLLTFFFRHMLPLIDKGYLYIAQPPLYKAKVGKVERYLKDDSELKAFLFDWAANNSELIIQNKKFENDDWKKLLGSIIEYDNAILKLSHNLEITTQFCHQMVKFLQSINWKPGKFETQDIFNKLVENFKEYSISGMQEEKIEGDMALESEVKHKAVITFKQLKKVWELPVKFFELEDVAKLLELLKPLEALENVEWDLKVQAKNVDKKGNGILELGNAIVKTGKSLMTIQRYKGLGEMNPEQLWETTMDPKTRTLLQVTIEDAIKADQWFAGLMGDCVDERKLYIEQKAVFVKNLDV